MSLMLWTDVLDASSQAGCMFQFFSGDLFHEADDASRKPYYRGHHVDWRDFISNFDPRPVVQQFQAAAVDSDARSTSGGEQSASSMPSICRTG